MATGINYFSHDYDSRQDEKIKCLLRKHGMLGYGVFWSIVEDLYANKNELKLDYEQISYDYRISEDLAKSIIHDFGLFQIDGNLFSSNSVQKRLNERKSRSESAKSLAMNRWGTDNSEARQKAKDTIFYVLRIYSDTEQFIKVGITSESISRRYSGKLNGYSYEVLIKKECGTMEALELETLFTSKFKSYRPLIHFAGSLECIDISEKDSLISFAMQHHKFRDATKFFRNAINKSINKENKEKDNEEINFLFEKFWGLYDKKQDREKCYKIFSKLAQTEIDKIFETLPMYILNTPDKKYRKNPQTWLNGKCWNDEDYNASPEAEKQKPVTIQKEMVW